MSGVTQKTCYGLRRDISEKIHRMPMRYFESRTVGEVLSRITNDVDTLGQSLNQSVTTLITSVTTLIGVLVMMLTISPLMTLIALVILPVSAGLVMLVVKHSQKYFVAQQKYLGKINGQVEETYSGHSVVRAFNREEEVIREFDQTNAMLFKSAWLSQFLSGMMQPIMTFVGNLGYVAVAVSGSMLAVVGAITVGDIQAFIQYLRQFTQPVRVNDYTYSVRIDEITYEKEAGTDEVIGVTHYYYTDPYGLEDAEDILIYLPGAPLGQLPQEFRSWVGYSENTRDELPFYALNNEVHQQGFSSYDRLESIRESLEGWVEPYAAELETEITSGEFTQEVCEEKAARMYEIWDGQLNDLWDCLGQRLDPAELEPLAAEQEAWAARKEEQVTQAGADPHEGCTQAAAEDMAEAELTRDRVYELLDWLDRNET